MSNQCCPSAFDSEFKRKDVNEINSRVENCGSCCLIHQQFTLTENISITGTTKIYRAPDNLFANASPFGTVIVSNCGCTPFTVIFRTGVNNTNGIIVPPKGQFAITGSIREIDIEPTNPNPRPYPICAVFSFDLFLILPACSAPDNDFDISINNNSVGGDGGSATGNSAAIGANLAAFSGDDNQISQTATN